MLQLDSRLAERHPRWFRGRHGRIAVQVIRRLERRSWFDAIDGFLREYSLLRGMPFVQAALAFLQADYRVEASDLARIPPNGPLLMVANHPSGALDALALLDAVGRVRQDMGIVANDLLGAIGQLDGLLLPVRIFGGRARTA